MIKINKSIGVTFWCPAIIYIPNFGIDKGYFGFAKVTKPNSKYFEARLFRQKYKNFCYWMIAAFITGLLVLSNYLVQYLPFIELEIYQIPINLLSLLGLFVVIDSLKVSKWLRCKIEMGACIRELVKRNKISDNYHGVILYQQVGKFSKQLQFELPWTRVKIAEIILTEYKKIQDAKIKDTKYDIDANHWTGI